MLAVLTPFSVLELHRQRTGQFAASLCDLVPQDLAELPVDPYDGQPLKVRQIGDRRWLYSVGEDGQDDTRGWEQKIPRSLSIPGICRC